MKKFDKRVKSVLLAAVVLGTLGFGVAQAVGWADPDSGCPYKAGCRYGGGKIGCCVPR